MLIREAERRDFEKIGLLMQQLNPDDPDFSQLNLSVLKKILDDPSLVLLVAEADEELLGSAYLNIIPNLSRCGRPYALIENMIVDSEHRQKGIGKDLVEHIIELAWKVGCYKIMLLTGRKGEAVHAFYKKLGFSADTKQAYIMRAQDS